MATTAEINAVRREARLRQYEYFNKVSGTALELTKQQPPLTIMSITRNTTALAETSGYTFDGYRTITLTTTAAETDVIRAEVGTTVTDSDIGEVIDFSKEELYGHMRLYYSLTDIESSSFMADMVEKLSAGYLIMKYWEGYANGNDFWKHGRNLVDTVHARIDDIKDGEFQMITSATTGTKITKEILPFQYKVLDVAPGLMPSEIYSQTAETIDDEEY
jgi:hypothetical protein